MSAKNYLKVLQIGIISSLFFVLFVFSDLLFPYISSKQIPFNILMEILAIIAIIFVYKYKEYRPKLNWMIYGLLAYFGVILMSTFTGVDFNLSFWGDVERMLGFFHIFHFLIFFFILIIAFRNFKDYRNLFLASIGTAVIVSLIGLFGDKPHSTIGNTTYVSGFIIFNLFFSAILFFRSQNKWRYAYLLPVIVMLLQFKNMRTSGAIIGLAAGLFVAIFLVGLLNRNKKIKYTLLSLSLLALISVSFIFSQQEATWFQNSFLKNLTSEKVTFKTRLLSWESAANDFKNHPVIGTGFGNYAIIFDRHFDPIFYNYDRNETYFDRAHNNLIDIASTTGALGLITYLSILVFVFVYLIRLWKEDDRKISFDYKGKKNLELVLVAGLFIAYFVQNLAVFDSFVTYLGLMMSLAFVYYLYQEERVLAEEGRAETGSKIFKEKILLVLGAILSLILIISIFYNIQTYRMLQGVIKGYSQIASADISEGLTSFKEVLSGNALERDARSSLLNLVSANPIILTNFKDERARTEFAYLISLSEKNLSYNPLDSLMLLQSSQLYYLGAQVFSYDKALMLEYSNKALEMAQRAIDSSPGRIPNYYAKADALLMLDRSEEARETLEYALDLNQDYIDSYCQLISVYEENSEELKLGEVINSCIDGEQVARINDPNSLVKAAQFLVKKEDYTRALPVMERLAKINSSDPNMWMNLAKLYVLTGAPETTARAAAAKAVALDASFSEQMDELFFD